MSHVSFLRFLGTSTAEKATPMERVFKESYVHKHSDHSILEKRKDVLKSPKNKLIDDYFAPVTDGHDSLRTENDLLKYKEERLLSRFSLLDGLRVIEL